MTSNQIQASSVREDERHNKMTEEITQNYNSRVLSLEDKKMKMDAIFKSTDAALRATELGIKAKYNNASLAEKREYDMQLAQIERDRTDNDLNYRNSSLQLQEDINKAEKLYKERMAKVAEVNNALRDKELTYKRYRDLAEIRNMTNQLNLAQRNYDLRKAEVNYNYSLGLINAQTRKDELKLEEDKLEQVMTEWLIKEKNMNADTAKKYIEASGGVIKAISTVIDSILPF